MSAGAFCALQRFLYTNDLSKGEDCGEGLAVGEMAQVADRFQAVALYVHCVQMFTEGLKVGNAIERLVQVQDLKLDALQQLAWAFVLHNYHAIQVLRLSTSVVSSCCL